MLAVSAPLADSGWADFAVVMDAVLIGVPLGPSAVGKAWGKSVAKSHMRTFEIGASGRSPRRGCFLPEHSHGLCWATWRSFSLRHSTPGKHFLFKGFVIFPTMVFLLR